MFYRAYATVNRGTGCGKNQVVKVTEMRSFLHCSFWQYRVYADVAGTLWREKS